MGDKLFSEYESVMSRSSLFATCPLSPIKRAELWTGFANVCEWVNVSYLWRPNLPDEGDNHVFELAVAGGAAAIVTQNVRYFKRAELRFPEVEILTPGQFIRKVV
jgi:predicted nucleic acid-binding protein